MSKNLIIAEDKDETETVSDKLNSNFECGHNLIKLPWHHSVPPQS